MNLKIYAILIINVCILFSCGISDSEKRKAKEAYSVSIKIAREINRYDSEYVACVQLLMREIQSPNMKIEKKQSIKDSIALLALLTDSLNNRLNTAEEEINMWIKRSGNITIIENIDSLIAKYKTTSNNNYSLINKTLQEISLPIKDSDYTHLLKLSYKADSTLNLTISKFNKDCKNFSNRYKISK